MKAKYGVDSMPETGENVAAQFAVSREGSGQVRASQPAAHGCGLCARVFEHELLPVRSPEEGGAHHGEPGRASRETTLEALMKLPTPFRASSSVTAGNASGVNDELHALVLATESGEALRPYAEGLGSSGRHRRAWSRSDEDVVGPAIRRVLSQSGLGLEQMDTIKLNEAFASQALAVLRTTGSSRRRRASDPNGGAIALGHPWDERRAARDDSDSGRKLTVCVPTAENKTRRFACCGLLTNVKHASKQHAG